ncbi:hypothetical protein BO78DRAFT_390474 [Aspergillus sclerotiicarbonarius CBS 121057]|uniref:Amino acid permease/ SLC12A domain-containing protein n=1 Tax=Aspergillus sclerotiicarbonarius (strain CBS 121057 / IBT 28362) TaxID=1448318 RepID=A0A319DWN1_ASPSB|nr:hypothetical protein BO78DRAFT_390474 [Aspergillus sclerotiicarbonarius CBS 121057]
MALMDQRQIEPDATKKVDSILEPQSDIPSDCTSGEIVQRPDALQRHLTSRQIQFIAIGGSIGTALFVNNALAEMTIFMPVSAAFIQHASVWVDSAWGFMIGWNFCVFEGLLIPFEITALDMILSFWRDDIPAAAVISACIVLYARARITNVFGVKYFGEAEFWLAGGKLLLITILFLFTFITMIGGNPQHDAYGFRNWSKPSPFVEYISTGDLGRFQGVLAALWQAAFTIVGPEYLACVAGEAQQPRKTLKTAFKSVYWRFGVFFIGGAFCVGIILPANDPTLLRVLGAGDTGTGASSPYVIAMTNMGIEVLPDLVNALLFTSIYSAGNAYVYTTSRSLHGLAQNGHAPKFFRKCTKDGVPIYCLAVALAFACLSFLKLGSGSVQVLTWLTNLITGGTLVTYIVVALAARSCRIVGISWIALIWLLGVEFFYGYAVFLNGRWDIGSFFSDYTMAFLAIATFAGWKICKRTRFVRPQEADLVWARPAIDAHEAVMEEVDQVGVRERLMHTLRTKWKGGRSTSTGMV